MEESSDLDLHHRLTQQFQVGTLHQELRRFADGVAFSETHIEFQEAVSRLHFVPVVETIVETKHAVSTRLHRRDTHAGPVMVSLHNRMVIVEQRMKQETSPSFFTRLSEQLAVAEN